MKKSFLFFLIAILSSILIYSCISSKPGGNSNIFNSPKLPAKAFTPEKAILLKDNDLSFASKIDIIRKAKQKLQLIYYIIDPDESTSYLFKAILDKVQSNKDFQVQILTDYQWNYKNLDFFRWLENQQPHGVQQIEVRFYNRPTINVIKFAEFMTLGCSNASGDSTNVKMDCSKEKIAFLRKFDQMSLEEAEKNMSTAAKIFLAGLYAKNPHGLLYATQIGYERTMQSMSQNPTLPTKMDEKQKQQLGKIAGLYWKSKAGNGVQRLGARLQLAVLGALFGKKLNPIFKSVETFLPFTVKDSENNPLIANRDLDYLTDYTHHKFLFSDNNQLLIGGRNLANSYHMNPNALVQKYIFMDTDIYFKLLPESTQLFSNSFERLWNFRQMVATTDEIARHAPIAYLYLIEKAGKQGEQICSAQSNIADQQICVGGLFSLLLNEGTQNVINEKQEEWEKLFEQQVAAFEKNYLLRKNKNKSWTATEQLFDSDQNDIQTISSENQLHSFSSFNIGPKEFFYIENLPFDQRYASVANRERRYGSAYGEEVKYGKVIHKVWADAIEEACKESQNSSTPVEVIIHQGYFSPAEKLLHDMNRIMQTNICPNVVLKLYTNSIQSTDLTPINFIGRRQLYALSQNNPLFNQDKFHYYEYDEKRLNQIMTEKFLSSPNQQLKSQGGSFSLHSKVMIFGNDIYIGSSNADFRSYMMDTNNGILLKDADELVARYKAFLSELEEEKIVFPAKQNFQFSSKDQMKAQEQKDIRALVDRYNMGRFATSSQRQIQMQAFINEILQSLDRSSTLIEKALKKEQIKGKSELDQLLKMM